MSLPNKVFLACESLLRVPPLLVIDEIFRSNFGLSDKWLTGEHETGIFWNDDTTTLANNHELPRLSSDTSFVSTITATVASLFGAVDIAEPTPHYLHLEIEGLEAAQAAAGELFKVIKVLALVQLCGAALICFVLSTKNLMKLYSYILAFASVYLCWYIKPLPLNSELEWTSISLLLPNLLIRCLLAGIYSLTRVWPGGYPQTAPGSLVLIVLNVLDALMFSMFFVAGVVRFPGIIFLSLVILLQVSLWTSLPKLYHSLSASWEDTKRVRNDYGISHLIQVETGRLRVNVVFRLFWLSRALYDLFLYLPSHSLPNTLRLVTTNGTDTLIGIIGLTLTVSGLAHQIGAFLMWLLYQGANSEIDINRFGSISTVLFFILCLQTSLTSLVPEKRLDRLLKNLVLLATALLHAIHQMVAPLLHAFRSFQPIQQRAVGLALIFLTVSIWSSIVILTSTEISTWSLAVIALGFEFKIKIIVSLLISIFVYFSQRVDSPTLLTSARSFFRGMVPQRVRDIVGHMGDEMDNDDIIFYLKAFSQSAEFVTGIFLLGNAVCIFLFESASAIRALGMTIHAYFNIWCEAKKGLRIYLQRRSASRKIESLVDASPEQLSLRRDDVCAICYEEMESAKVTLCGHLFHAVCLRKWLYIQNTCPLCHEILYADESEDQETEEDEEDPGNNGVGDELGQLEEHEVAEDVLEAEEATDDSSFEQFDLLEDEDQERLPGLVDFTQVSTPPPPPRPPVPTAGPSTTASHRSRIPVLVLPPPRALPDQMSRQSLVAEPRGNLR